MKALHSKDLASHADLESCAAYREVRSEALTEARIGQPSSRESWFSPGADAVHGAEGKTDGRAIAQGGNGYLRLEGRTVGAPRAAR